MDGSTKDYGVVHRIGQQKNRVTNFLINNTYHLQNNLLYVKQ